MFELIVYYVKNYNTKGMKIPLVIKIVLKDFVAGKILGVLVLLALMMGCEDEKNLPKYDPPSSHTISKDGSMHMSGLDQPLTNCTACHGADLKGGTSGVSCFECHGQEW